MQGDLPVQKISSGPLSRTARYDLYVSGAWGSRECENLIRMLRLQLEWLKEDEAAIEADRSPSPTEGDGNG
jgi:hypothetical protein